MDGDLLGTVRLRPGQESAPIYGRRVRIVARQVDPVPGRAAVGCVLLDEGSEVGLLVEQVEWDDPAAVTAWLAATPAPLRPARRGGRPAAAPQPPDVTS